MQRLIFHRFLAALSSSTICFLSAAAFLIHHLPLPLQLLHQPLKLLLHGRIQTISSAVEVPRQQDDGVLVGRQLRDGREEDVLDLVLHLEKVDEGMEAAGPFYDAE